jgi:hypothetical protein
MKLQFRKINKEKKARVSYFENFGFTSIYRDLISQTLPIKRIKSITGSLVFPAAAVFSIVLTYFSDRDGLSLSNYILWSIYLFLIYSFVFIVVGWIVGFIAFSVSMRPSIPLVTARIIISTRSPYAKRYGLNASEIQHLKKIAEIDQASADWKNGFLSIGILALLFAAIQWSSQEISNFIQSTLITPPQQDFITSFYSYAIYILWLFSTIITFGLAFSIFSPLVEFLANEPINRGIINSCEEGLAILKTLKLHKKDSLTISNKNKVAEICLCQIVPKPADNRYWGLKTSQFADNRQKEWLLLPPAALIDGDVLKAEESIARRKRFIERVKRLFSSK